MLLVRFSAIWVLGQTAVLAELEDAAARARLPEFNLNTGKVLWRVPLGEVEELTQQGVPLTGAQNYGGATVTAGGLVLVSGTQDERLRAFDADTSQELWSAKLPFQGSAAPAIYEADGRQFVVITATGRAKFGGKAGLGDAYVAFALPK